MDVTQCSQSTVLHSDLFVFAIVAFKCATRTMHDSSMKNDCLRIQTRWMAEFSNPSHCDDAVTVWKLGNARPNQTPNHDLFWFARPFMERTDRSNETTDSHVDKQFAEFSSALGTHQPRVVQRTNSMSENKASEATLSEILMMYLRRMRENPWPSCVFSSFKPLVGYRHRNNDFT